jgi:hypothetical protein
MSNAIDVLLGKLDESEYLADLFLVLHLDDIEQPIASTERLQLQVPQCLDDLFVRDSEGADKILEALMIWARPEIRAFSESALAIVVDEIRSRYSAFKQNKFLQTIPDESNGEIAAVLAQVVPAATEQKEQEGIIQRMKKIVRMYLTTVFTRSKRTGRAILMRGRELAELVRDWVISLELPSKVDQLVNKKAAFASRLFAFKGGHATRFCIGVLLEVVGLLSGAPAINIGGVAFAFVDP